jgi:GTP cyclohydrolase I
MQVSGEGSRVKRVEQEMERILVHLDPDADRDGLDDTPGRVARMWVKELTSGYLMNVKEMFRTFDADGYDGMVIVKDIPLTSMCEHHLLPFVGYAHVGYLPSDKVVGLSKVARVVNAYAKRLQIQERITGQVADAIEEHLNPKGVIVVCEAEHLCMTFRGVQAPGTKTITSAVRGVFNTNQEGEKDEFLRLIGKE